MYPDITNQNVPPMEEVKNAAHNDNETNTLLFPLAVRDDAGTYSM